MCILCFFLTRIDWDDKLRISIIVLPFEVLREKRNNSPLFTLLFFFFFGVFVFVFFVFFPPSFQQTKLPTNLRNIVLYWTIVEFGRVSPPVVVLGKKKREGKKRKEKKRKEKGKKERKKKEKKKKKNGRTKVREDCQHAEARRAISGGSAPASCCGAGLGLFLHSGYVLEARL